MEVDSGDGAPSGRDGSSADSGNTNSEAQATGAGKDAPQGAKRPLSPGARGRATKDTWTEEDCGGEGHSFYNCISAGFIIKTTGTTLEAVKNDGTLQAKGKGLRARLAAYIEAHAQRCRPYFTPNTGASRAQPLRRKGSAFSVWKMVRLLNPGSSTSRQSTDPRGMQTKWHLGQHHTCWASVWF